jgi:ATP-binding cassette subfamily F protein 3
MNRCAHNSGLKLSNMIQVFNLDKSYGKQVLFQNVSFTINTGERIGLVGRNGHGKTTLLKMLLRQEHPDDGTISIPNGYRIGHLSQHIRFTESTVLKEACLSLPAGHGKDRTYKAEAVLMGLGFLTDDFMVDPLQLSGGYQVRLNLAKVLVSDPNMLVLDEPTNYLDIVSLRWLAQFLRNWKKELIIITHDRSFMDSVTTHTMAIHRCQIKKSEGTTEKIYQQLLMEEEIYEKTRINDEKKRKETEQFITRFRAKATKARAVQSRIKALEKKKRLERLTDPANLEFTFNAAPFTGRQLMEVRDLSFGFHAGEPPLIDGLSFYVGKSDRIAIIGKNGKGKTTLLNLLAGELTPVRGTVQYHKHLKFAYFGQTNIIRLDPEKTVEEEIMDAHPEQNRGTARGICGAMMFSGDNALKKISILSGGEKSRVLLGKLLVSPANLLLLDEPTNHLDMESTESLLESADAFGGAVIIVTHSEMILHALATRLIVFDGGKASLFEGTYQDFLDRVGWQNEMTKTTAKTGNTSNPAVNKKALRRIRADLVNEKSRTLGGLQKKIDEIESSIMHLEEKTEQDNKELLDASVRGDGETIKKLSKAVHSARSEIESLFVELEDLHVRFEEQTREFEEKLSAIE